jgi:hypothetical protein
MQIIATKTAAAWKNNSSCCDVNKCNRYIDKQAKCRSESQNAHFSTTRLTHKFIHIPTVNNKETTGQQKVTNNCGFSA